MSPTVLSELEKYALAGLCSAVIMAAEQGNAEVEAEAEGRLSHALREFLPGEIVLYCGIFFVVQPSTEAGRVDRLVGHEVG